MSEGSSVVAELTEEEKLEAQRVAAEEVGPYRKTAEGWEVVIDIGDGAGVQKFSGKTKDEVSQKLIDAQINATKKIRQQERIINLGGDDQDIQPDKAVPLPTFEPVELTDEESAQLKADLQDPEKSAAAHIRLMEIQFGAPLPVVRNTLRRGVELEQAMKARAAGDQFASRHPELKRCIENGKTLVGWLEKRNMPPTINNMEIAYRNLRGTSLLIYELEESDPALGGGTPPNTPTPVVAAAGTSDPQPQPINIRPRTVSTSLSPRTAAASRPGATSSGNQSMDNDAQFMAEADLMSTDEYGRNFKNVAFRDRINKISETYEMNREFNGLVRSKILSIQAQRRAASVQKR